MSRRKSFMEKAKQFTPIILDVLKAFAAFTPALEPVVDLASRLKVKNPLFMGAASTAPLLFAQPPLVQLSVFSRFFVEFLDVAEIY